MKAKVEVDFSCEEGKSRHQELVTGLREKSEKPTIRP